MSYHCRNLNYPKAHWVRYRAPKSVKRWTRVRLACMSLQYDEAIQKYRSLHYTAPSTATKKIVHRILCELLAVKDTGLGTQTPYMGSGLTSIDLIRFKTLLETEFALPQKIPLITIMITTTISELAQKIDELQTVAYGPSSEGASVITRPYNPLVALNKPTGRAATATPLFLFHPGVDEILIFLTLVQHLLNRPVYAFRA